MAKNYQPDLGDESAMLPVAEKIKQALQTGHASNGLDDYNF
jgi:hypothetical protein